MSRFECAQRKIYTAAAAVHRSGDGSKTRVFSPAVCSCELFASPICRNDVRNYGRRQAHNIILPLISIFVSAKQSNQLYLHYHLFTSEYADAGSASYHIAVNK